jgi:hypothetical protein
MSLAVARGTSPAVAPTMRDTTSLQALALDDLARVRGGCKQKQAPAPQVVQAPPPPQQCDAGFDVSVKVATGGAQPPRAA